MPYATNPTDGIRIYFEDNERPATPVVLTFGLMDPVAAAKSLELARALEPDFRLIFPDHRGHGRSDKPYKSESYAITRREGDILAVLDAAGIEMAHYVGVSWGARLGFALGEDAPQRFLSLTLIGNQPYAWDPSWAIVSALAEGLERATREGMHTLAAWFEELSRQELREPARTWLLDNDPLAIQAAWGAALAEGSVACKFAGWTTPTLIVAGELDEMHGGARMAAEQIPNATFVSLSGLDHLESLDVVDATLPEVRRLLRGAQG